MSKRALLILSLCLSASGVACAQSKTDSLRKSNSDDPLHTLTGNVDDITTKRMNKGLLTGALDALHGQAVGVTIADPNNTEAMLHAVRVRGTTSLTGGNDPLVIIDGVYADLTTLSNIFPADIERFQILKDASETSQYGSRGASGVIVVETKKGRLGDFHISYDVTTGPELVYKQLKMLSADGYRTAVRQRGNYLVDKGFNTDFQDAITRTGFVQNHHIAFGGGTNQSNYRASLGFMQHNQVIQTIGSRNFTAKFDISQKGFDDRLQIDLGVFGNIQKNKFILDVQ
ncbi:MAG: TonB-dependent receptor plug domain-containing protein, partial [Alloprevotella tannerae]|nr:TonB-dependent receptor plug domain-containing protein [Alloprevotella tannerae]